MLESVYIFAWIVQVVPKVSSDLPELYYRGRSVCQLGAGFSCHFIMGKSLVVRAVLRAEKVGASSCAKDPGYGVVKKAEKGPSLGPLRLGLIRSSNLQLLMEG